jgi:integrase/recombinase XerC
MALVCAAPSLPAATEAACGTAFFQAWRASRLLDTHRKPMGASGLHQAEFIWGKWLAFCSVRGTCWHKALPADIRAFAGDITPRKLSTAIQVSPVTLRRYWRILNDLYAYGVLSQRIADNPAAEVMPVISEKTSSLALPPHMWALLQDGLPGGYEFKARRNRLALLLMMRCALTVSEILTLTIDNAKAHAGEPGTVAQRLALAGLPLVQPESACGAPLDREPPPPCSSLIPNTYCLQLSGSRPVQTRQLVLDARTSQALQDWLEVRKVDKAGKAAPNDRLIVGASNGSALSPKGLYNICQAHMAKCLQGIDIAQMGPNTLRNTCISLWLNQGVELTEIMRRCGLKDPGVLVRLQKHIHFTASVPAHADAQ